jgi:hypothetical protein
MTLDQETIRTIVITLPVLVTAVSSAMALRKAKQTNAKVHQVYEEVKTGNELRAGELATAAETRRIAAIPADERTDQEQRHLDWPG